MARTANVPSTSNLVEGEVIPQKEFFTFSRNEYDEYSASKGTFMGRKEGEKTKLSIEELRILINEQWTPEEVKGKHGLSDEELKQVVWALSKAEQREKPIKFGKL